MRRYSGRAQSPRPRAPARDDRGAWVARAILEAERGTGTFGSIDEGLPRGTGGRARLLFIAVEYCGDIHAGEHPGVVQCSQRFEDDHIATLHVDDSRTGCRGVAQTHESLKRTARFEHGIQMSDQKQLGAGTGIVGDEVTDSMKRGPVYPTCFESQRVELWTQYVGNPTHT